MATEIQGGFNQTADIFTMIVSKTISPARLNDDAIMLTFVSDTSSVFVYFYAPMAIVLIFNLVLYIFTTWKIMGIQRETKILHSKSSNATGGASSQNDKQR